MKWVHLTGRYRDGKNVRIAFPYDERLIALVKQIPGRRWDPEEKVWRCPLSSLPEIIAVLEPEGFSIADGLRRMLPEVEATRATQDQRWQAERLAAEHLQQSIADGEEIAFVPANNSMLTRKLKEHGAYEVIREEGDYGQQVAGMRVREQDLVETLRDMGGTTEPLARLVVLLHYAWAVNVEAKETRYASSQYRYMKKGCNCSGTPGN